MKDQYEQSLRNARENDKGILPGMKEIMKVLLLVPWQEASGCKKADVNVFYQAKATYKIFFLVFQNNGLNHCPLPTPLISPFFQFLCDSETEKRHPTAYENKKLEYGSPAFYKAMINDLKWNFAIFNRYLDLRHQDIEELGNDVNKISAALNRNYSFDVPAPSKKKK